MINIIVNSDSQFQINKFAMQAAALEVLKRHNVQENIEIGITIVGDRKMHEINKKFRGLDTTTNVLSFSYEDSLPVSPLMHFNKMGFIKAPDQVIRLGDIVISYPEAQRDASNEGVSVEDELNYLVEHGTRHLLGVHHE